MSTTAQTRPGAHLLRTLSTELRKAATLPAVWAGIAVTVGGMAAITVLNAMSVRSAVAAGEPERVVSTSPFDTAYAAAPLGTVGAVVIGVVVLTSEYTAASVDLGGARQLGTTLTAVPRRLALLAAKAVTVVLAVVVGAILAFPLSAAIARAVIGDLGVETVARDQAFGWIGGATLYWSLMGLIALAIATMVRSGIIPLIVLVVNSSVVSVSMLLANLTDAAYWLPDAAGMRLFGGLVSMAGGPSASVGALVMAAWALGLLAVAGAMLQRRDA